MAIDESWGEKFSSSIIELSTTDLQALGRDLLYLSVFNENVDVDLCRATRPVIDGYVSNQDIFS